MLMELFPFISTHFSITLEIPLKVIYRGYSYKVIPNSWKNNQHTISNLNLINVIKTYSLVAIYYCLSTVHYVLSTLDYVILIVAFHDSLLTILVTPEVATIAHHASIMVRSCQIQDFGAGPGAVAQTCTECNFLCLGSPVPLWILESHTFMMVDLLPT